MPQSGNEAILQAWHNTRRAAYERGLAFLFRSAERSAIERKGSGSDH